MRRARGLAAFFALAFFFSCPVHAARDASFMAPSAPASSAVSRGDGAVGIEPKSEIDLGDTGVNVAKRTTLFFTNLTNLPVEVLDITASGDSSVEAQIVTDDCKKVGQIEAASRCSVTVEVTPKAAGLWTAEVLMTHNGAGRLARAKLTGKTTAGAEKKETGLALSSKEIKPIDFGTLDVGSGKAVRSALMVNDSNDPITLLSIEVIAAENGLERLDQQGCLPDMELKSGESCPITLVWNPKQEGIVSTDLIIRHSGRLGFAVIPIRGAAKETKESKAARDQKDASAQKKTATSPSGAAAGIPMSPTADDLEKMLTSGKVDDVAGALAAVPASALGDGKGAAQDKDEDDEIHLIGTVGNRGVFYLPDGTTQIAGAGDTLSSGKKGPKVVVIMARQAEIESGGKRKTLPLEQASALTGKAAQSRKDKVEQEKKEALQAKKKTSSSKKRDE